jgi:hypothetical protein
VLVLLILVALIAFAAVGCAVLYRNSYDDEE